MQKLLWILAFTSASIAQAQIGRGGDWTTSGYDAQRSFWLRTDAKISPASMQKPGFQFLWKMKLNNTPRELNSLTPPVLLDRLIGYKGFRSLGFVGGSSDKVFAIDTDLARMEWEKSLSAGAPPRDASLACPGGLTAMLTRPTSVSMAATPAWGGGGGGRGSPALSAVGVPDEGAVTLAQVAARAAAVRRPNIPPAAPGSNRGAMPVYALSSDGMLHELNIANGADLQPPLKFLPPNANAGSLIVVDNIVYSATDQNCGGAPNGVWALDLMSKQVATWKSNVRVAGPAFGPDGTLFVTTSNGELLALEPKTLNVKETYKSGGQAFTSSPIIFAYKTKVLVAAATQDGRVHLLDTAALERPLYKSPAFNLAADKLATWQDPGGTRWLLAPTARAILAFKIAEQNGMPAMEQGWVSRELVSPLAPMIINGVVFAASSGEFQTTDTKMTAARRAQRSSAAVLYALDGATGKEMWSSDRTITSFASRHGLSGGGSQVYLSTYDGILYTFGFPIEH